MSDHRELGTGKTLQGIDAAQIQLAELRRKLTALEFVAGSRGLPLETRRRLRQRIYATQVQINRVQRRIDGPQLRILGKA